MSKSHVNQHDEDFFKEFELASGDELGSDIFPQLYNISSAFLYQYIFRPLPESPPEFVYVPFNADKVTTEEDLAFHKWNMCWEAGQLRSQLFEDELPAQLKWLKEFGGGQIYIFYLIPSQDMKPTFLFIISCHSAGLSIFPFRSSKKEYGQQDFATIGGYLF
jgi:hypothetical protein